MKVYLNASYSLLLAFAVSLLIAPLVIRFGRALKIGQPVLKYVEIHKEKSGTPTFGGIIFLLPVGFVPFLFFTGLKSIAVFVILITVGYGIIGFTDDFIKVKFKNNQGLKVYQKLMAQIGIALIVSFYAYKSGLIGSKINIPFSSGKVDLGWFSVVLYCVVFIATVNSVNLTDGLDGLAGGSVFSYLITFSICIFIQSYYLYQNGSTEIYLQYSNVLIVLFALTGGLLGFLCFNYNKASVFMGDTGSLALGGALASAGIFTQNTLLIPLIGIMFVITSLSDLIQVSYFKLTGGKRVFSMAPLHHHLQNKGLSESKIAGIYSVITFIAGVVGIMSVR